MQKVYTLTFNNKIYMRQTDRHTDSDSDTVVDTTGDLTPVNAPHVAQLIPHICSSNMPCVVADCDLQRGWRKRTKDWLFCTRPAADLYPGVKATTWNKMRLFISGLVNIQIEEHRNFKFEPGINMRQICSTTLGHENFKLDSSISVNSSACEKFHRFCDQMFSLVWAAL